MKIKVCGMRDQENITALAQVPIDLIGFIFYPKSPRDVATTVAPIIDKNIKKVGVFVNADIDFIIAKAQNFGLDYIQLHGNESVDFCATIKDKGYTIFKAFAVDELFDFEKLKAYESVCDFFLLDTKGKSYGGNGIQFDWAILKKYTSSKPFLLSGGISIDSVAAIQALNMPQLYAIDINSKFELAPAVKDISLIQHFVRKIKT